MVVQPIYFISAGTVTNCFEIAQAVCYNSNTNWELLGRSKIAKKLKAFNISNSKKNFFTSFVPNFLITHYLLNTS